MAYSGFIPGLASQSLGKAAYHDIKTKLEACSRHGFRGIEIFFEDLETASGSLPATHKPLPSGSTFPSSTTHDERLLAAATYIHTICRTLRLHVICLQPFMHYEGLRDRNAHSRRIQEMKLWFRLADRLNTDLIQIPSSFLPEYDCTSDLATVVTDFQEVADLGLQHRPRPIRFAHEALAWGTHTNTWDRVWEIVKLVDRPNFGTCLDTFNLAGRVWADPSRPSGKTANADEDLQQSLQKMRDDLDISKVFYVEIVDAERLDQPLDQSHPWYVDGQPARMTWSRNARLFPFEERGYLPIMDIVKVICGELGYRGHISFEFFSRTLSETHSAVPEEHAARAEKSWRKLVEYMGWNDDVQNNDQTSRTQSQRHADAEQTTEDVSSQQQEKQQQQCSQYQGATLSSPQQPRSFIPSPLASLWRTESGNITPPVY